MLANFVQETAVNPGTAATINLAGAAAGRRSFAAAFASGAAVFYAIEDGTLWEIGHGTFTDGSPDTLARTAVLSNSAGTTARMNFTGTARVYCILPAERAVYTDADGDLVGVTAAKLRGAAGATTVGAAVLTAADEAAARTAIGAVPAGPIGSSGLLMSADRLLGRTAAGVGEPADITVGAGLTLSGGELSADEQPQKYVQCAYAEYTTSASVTTAIPLDDSTPTSSEGTQILSVSITPTSDANRLRARFQGWGSAIEEGTPRAMNCAMFTGTTCRAASSAPGGSGMLCAEFEYVPGSTSSVTISVRVGAASGALRLNGDAASSARRFGGASRATLVVEEILA
jgi:hypothetical protein